MPNKFYVYAYLRSTDLATKNAGTPYYIGKRCSNRARDKHSNIRLEKFNATN